MKANKIVCTVTVEVLSKDSIPHLLELAAARIEGEYTSGNLTADDGDTVAWGTTQTEVEF